MAKFGTLLRRTRSEVGVSMGKVARHLGMKVSHLSDVELGRRAPLSPDRIKKVGAFLQVDTTPLLLAAAEEKGVFELDTQNVSPHAREVVAALARELPALNDLQLDKIQEIVRPKGGR
jgi:transcriptional regulator with XRE-family HTH domain